ncbi:MAG TPA: sugar phosphate nucleotidyltransferase [bacterium]|nr:sugar phosphate nucleotidyltransferase [bacterium]
MTNVIIPAAGVGTRLRPHTHTAPKALLPVAGKPILGHILDRIAAVDGLGTIRLVVGFLGDQIEEYVRTRYDLNVRFVQQAELLGLGYAVHLALEDTPDDDPVLIILGDTILDVDLGSFVTGPEDAIGVKEVDDPRRFGVIETDGRYITRLVEKPADPPSKWAVVGLYGIHSTGLLRRCLKDVIGSARTSAGEIQMTDALQLMVERGSRMRAVPVDGWFDCGKVETLLQTNRHLLGKSALHYQLDGSIVLPPVYIAPSAVVERSVIGPYVSIGQGARVADTVVRNSIIADEAQVSRCVMEDSLVGARATVEGTAKRLNVGDSSAVGLP